MAYFPPPQSDSSPTSILSSTAFGTSSSKTETSAIGVSNFREIDFSFRVTNLGAGPITEIRAQVLFSLQSGSNPYSTHPQEWSFLLAENISGGVAAVDKYTVSLDATLGTYFQNPLAASGESFGIRAPVTGQRMMVLIWAETGNPTSSVVTGAALRRI